MNSAAFGREVRGFVIERCEAAMRRYFPSLRVPLTFAGHRIAGDFAVDFVYTLKFLHEAGVRELAGTPIVEIIRTILAQVDGDAIETFYSYRIAETILAFGKFDGDNALLAGMTQKQRENLQWAVDSTHVFDAAKGEMIGLPNNYWAVLARCEFGRQQLGILPDDGILRHSVERLRKLLAANPEGFFDDLSDGGARFDLYSFDSHLFLEPLWPLLEKDVLQRNLERHAALMETIAMENGAPVVWGRSIGALSVMMTIEFGALAARDGLGDRGRMLGLARHAFEKFKREWWADDLINAHRHKMTFNYRGPQRLLQMTFDLLCKLAWAAGALEEAGAKEGGDQDMEAAELFPERDEFVDFRPAVGESRSGVWMFRNKIMAFQLAVVGWVNSDYVAYPRSPGLFENPVDSFTLCGVPRVWMKTESGEVDYSPMGVPAVVEKRAGGLRLVYEKFTRNQGKAGPETLAGRREVIYQVEGDVLKVSEHWQLGQLGQLSEMPTAVGLSIPESVKRPLAVAFASEQEHSASVVHVEGMQFWRGFWGEMGRVHQVDFAPAKEIRLSYAVMPAMKVAQGPVVHDYNVSLYGGVQRDWVKEIAIGNAMCVYRMDVKEFVRDAEIVHLAWPEHLFRPHGMAEGEYDEKLIQFFRDLGKSGRKVVWTMHNRRPHGYSKERGVRLYREVAAVTDACLHHSKWGEGVMRADYPFRPECRHYLIPHPHFGGKMGVAATRGELEKKYGIPAARLRVGLLGRYQKEKQVEMILAAFAAAGRGDIQLVYNTYLTEQGLPANPPTGPNIFRLERPQWMERWQIAEHTKLCDVQVAAHTGDTYLTSGLMADALGIGIPMIVPNWEFFDEILGDAGIYHDNTLAGLTRVFGDLTVEQVAEARERSVRLAPEYSPEVLGLKLGEILREVRLS